MMPFILFSVLSISIVGWLVARPCLFLHTEMRGGWATKVDIYSLILMGGLALAKSSVNT